MILTEKAQTRKNIRGVKEGLTKVICKTASRGAGMNVLVSLTDLNNIGFRKFIQVDHVNIQFTIWVIILFNP